MFVLKKKQRFVSKYLLSHTSHCGKVHFLYQLTDSLRLNQISFISRSKGGHSHHIKDGYGELLCIIMR